MIFPFLVNINTLIYYERWIVHENKCRGWNAHSEAGNAMIGDTKIKDARSRVAKCEFFKKALIECLIGANCSVSWACLHFGPYNQWRWRRMTTSSFVSEWACGETVYVHLYKGFSTFEVRAFGIPRIQCVRPLLTGSTVKENRLGLRQNSLLRSTSQPDWSKTIWRCHCWYDVVGGWSHIE